LGAAEAAFVPRRIGSTILAGGAARRLCVLSRCWRQDIGPRCPPCGNNVPAWAVDRTDPQLAAMQQAANAISRGVAGGSSAQPPQFRGI